MTDMQTMIETIQALGFHNLQMMHDRWVMSCQECGALVMVPRPREAFQAPQAHHQWHVELSDVLRSIVDVTRDQNRFNRTLINPNP